MAIINFTRRKDEELLQEDKISSFDFGKLIVGFINHKNFQIISIEYGTNQIFMEILDFYVPLTIIYGRQKPDDVLEFDNYKISKVLHEIIISNTKSQKIARIELKHVHIIINFGSHFIYSAICKKYPFNTDSSGGRDLLMKSIDLLKKISPTEDFGKAIFVFVEEIFCKIIENEFNVNLDKLNYIIVDLWVKNKSWCYETDVILYLVCATICISVQDNCRKDWHDKIERIKKIYFA